MTGEAAIAIHKQSVVRRSIYGRHVRVSDLILTGLIYLCAGLSIAILAGIMGYVFVRGIPHVSWRFLTTVTSATKGTFGILGNIVNTLYIVVITLLIATPLGIGAAIYLNEYAKPGRMVKAIEFTTETLSGIPSIIFGLFGMVFFGNTLGLKYSILTGALTLTLMILPLITRTTQEALKTVPDSYRSGALGIGATKWYMIRTILLPSAMPGILTGVILAIGRGVGGPAVHRRKRLLYAEKLAGQGDGAGRNPDHPIISVHAEGEVQRGLRRGGGAPCDRAGYQWPGQVSVP